MANRNIKKVRILLFAGVSALAGAVFAKTAASEVKYFGSEIDFWHADAPRAHQEILPTTKGSSEKGEESKAEQKSFQWKPYLDPKSKDFFREGDYTPPEPFMELVRNPSDENIRMWFAYLEKKNHLADRLAQRMEEYAKKYDTLGNQEVKAKFSEAIQRMPTPHDDFERFRFRMYFDSQCPHCQKMFGTLNDLQDRGYFVEARQIDNGRIDGSLAHFPIVMAKAEELSRFKVKSVPLLLIGDMREKKVFRKSGFLTPNEIIQLIRDH